MFRNLSYQLRDFARRVPADRGLQRPDMRDLILLAAMVGAVIAGAA
jgi:hypothetical protein